MICIKCKKEIPDSQPYCTSVECLTFKILNTQLTPKGYYTQVMDFKYPLRAYPQEGNLHHVDTLKRVLIASARFIAKFPYSIDRILKEIARWMSDIYWADVPTRDRNRFPKEAYSESTQELIRVLTKLNPYYFEEFDKGGDGWVYYIAVIWETDLAYRFRGQDILSELNKENLAENPRKEILRLVDLALTREIGGVTPKIQVVRKLLNAALYSKKIQHIIASFLQELDLERIKPSIEDRYWYANRFDYNYEGKTYEERMAWKSKEDETYIRPVLPPEMPRLALNTPNDAFYLLSLKDATEMAETLKESIIQNWKDAHS